MDNVLETGFRFLPPDEEIISFFLKKKMMGDHKTTRYIGEVDLLKHEPWQLPAMSVVQSTYPEWFFFYKLNKISQRKNDRSTNDGYWKSTGADRPITRGDSVIGTKKTLVFYKGRTPNGLRTDWVMHEFRATADSLPPNADNSYVVGYLRDNAAEKNEYLISNVGQQCTRFAASSSQDNAVGATSTKSNSTDFDIALRVYMEEEGMFDSDLSPSGGLHSFPSSSAIFNNDQSRIEEERFSLEDFDYQQSDDLVDDENEWKRQFVNTIDDEMEFYGALFHNPDERTNAEAEYRDNAWFQVSDYEHDQIVHISGRGHAQGEGLNQRRMETGVSNDDVLIMDSGVESATVTAYEINCHEPVQEERSVYSRACKSEYEPINYKSAVPRHPRRVQLQDKSLGKAVSRDKARESGKRGLAVQPVQDKKSILQANKGPKMDRDRNTKLILNSRSKGSSGSSRKNSFNFVEMSQLSCKADPPLVSFRNLVLGLILFVVLVREVMFLR
ncbi:NAC domain-containing protein 30-like [Gossypium australe]|uniref:NAC domain-containing protein 30-like n=1 Tax=Gossypium australe TaxID=47621 RepID=A0A5B6UNN1_9ROSI|nr:NAC domain-containing protein 30-like [Gossypium australe]